MNSSFNLDQAPEYCRQCEAAIDSGLGRTAGAILGEEDGCLQLIARALHILLRHIVDHVAQLAHDAPRLHAQAMSSLLHVPHCIQCC